MADITTQKNEDLVLEAGIDMVGMGFTSSPIGGTTEQHLWDAMKQTVKNVSKYYPVREVRCKEISPNRIQRSFVYSGKGYQDGQRISEDVFIDETKREIRFVSINENGVDMDEEVVNLLRLDDHNVLGTISGYELTTQIEYFKRRISTQGRVPYMLPKEEAYNAAERTADVARVIQRSFGNN